MSNTLFIGKVYHHFDELPSTNDWVLEFLADSTRNNGIAKTRPPEGTVVRAANQTAGRGQFGSKWHSQAGDNLLVSILLYPTWLEAKAQFYLSMAVALGVREAIMTVLGVYRKSKEPVSTCAIKWPNDLYVENQKTAGLLIQNSLSGNSIQSSVVGIGLNVNQIAFSPDLPNATSLAEILGHPLSLDDVADCLYEGIERRYLQLKAGRLAAIKAAYEDLLWRRGELSTFVKITDDTLFQGIIEGITERGLLRVRTRAGEELFDLKELRVVSEGK